MKKWFKKKAKWHNCAGYELSKKWAKTVTIITPVSGKNFKDEWDFMVKYSEKENGPGYYSFRIPKTWERSRMVDEREALVAWVKEVQS